MGATVQQPVSPQVVGNAFVQQYYHILHQSPGLVHRFYQDVSKLGRPEDNGTMSITTTMQAINEKMLSLNYGEFRVEIKSVDAQDSFNGAVHVLVTGYLTGSDNVIRNFAQTFLLAPQEKGFFVLNDIFRYVGDINQHDVNNGPPQVEASLTPEQEHSTVMENHISVQTPPSPDEVIEEVYNPPENVEVSVMEAEMPVAKVVDEVQDDSQMVVETKSKIEEVPKKSYAYIVRDIRERGLPCSSPAPAPRRSVPKSQEQKVNSAPPQSSAAETAISSSDALENGNSQEGDFHTDGHSIYIKGLPMHATIVQLEDEFKKFGPNKSDDGIQVRSNKMANPKEEDLSKSATWDVTRDTYFVEQLVHQERIGQRQDSVWSKTAWRNVSVAFNEKFNTSYNVKMFKNRLTKLKEQYNIVKGLLGSNGFGWDDHYHMVVAENKLWDDYIRRNNKIKPFREKTFPLYGQLGLIFEGTIAEGKDALSTIRPSSESKKRENKSTSIPTTDATTAGESFEKDVDSYIVKDLNSNIEKDVAPGCDDEISQEVSNENRVNASSTRSTCRVRRHNASTGEKLVVILKDFLTNDEEKSRANQAASGSSTRVESSFIECLKELKLIEGLSVDEVMKGAHALKDKQNRMAFMTFEGVDRLAFLRSCFD